MTTAPTAAPPAMHEQIAQAINDVATCDPMWIGDDGEPLDYSPEREALIGKFVDRAATAVHQVVLSAEPRPRDAPMPTLGPATQAAFDELTELTVRVRRELGEDAAELLTDFQGIFWSTVERFQPERLAL